MASVTMSPGKVRRPTIISNKTQPNAKMSGRASVSCPFACSGDMYAAVPKITPAFVASIVSVGDPAGSAVTALQSLARQFSNKAITDEKGNLLLLNPSPGQVGSLGLRWIEGPPHLAFDANMIKHVKIAESKEKH